jgi:hypothetical protein
MWFGAGLAGNPHRRLVLQEIIHGTINADGQDRSVETLLRAARLKLSFPQLPVAVDVLHDHHRVVDDEPDRE